MQKLRIPTPKADKEKRILKGIEVISPRNSMKAKSFLTLFTLFSLVSCAHRTSPVVLSSDQTEKLNREALTLASSRLATMVGQAKNNPEIKNYLASDLFLKANMSLLRGDYTTSSELFKHLYHLVPEDTYVQKKYSISLIRGGELSIAEKVLEGLWEKEKEERVGLILAGVYTGMDKEDESIKIYKQILAINKNNEDACVFLSKGYVVKKQTDKAVSQLKSCSKANPKNGMYDFYLGKLYQDLGKKKEALASYRSSIKKQPSLGASVAALGSMYEEMENHPKAVQIYKNHLKKYPKDREILSRVVNTLFLMEKYEEVISFAEVLSDLDADNLNLKVKLGVLYTDTKQYPKAIGVFKDLLKAAPDSDKVLYYLGAIYQEVKNFENSIEYFSRITPQSGLYSDSSLQVVNMLSHLAQVEGQNSKWYSSFIEHVDKKLEEIEEIKLELSVVKASFFETFGDFDKASEALSLVKDDKKFSDQHVYYLASLLNKVEKFEESNQLIEGILKRDPNNAHAWNFLGYSLLERGVELDKSYEYIQKAVALAPEDGYIRDSLGWYYYTVGELDKALKELNYAVKQVPGDVEILKHLAIVHKELKDYSKAKSFIDRALSQVKYEDERQKILTVMEGIERARHPASGKDN